MARSRSSAFATGIRPRSVGILIIVLLTCACAAPTDMTARPHALLLVSLEDGTIIRQDVDIDADVCMKSSNDAATTCFKKGEPIFSEDQLQVIGYYMDRSEISLYAE